MYSVPVHHIDCNHSMCAKGKEQKPRSNKFVCCFFLLMPSAQTTWLPHCVLSDVEVKRATSTQQSSPHQLQGQDSNPLEHQHKSYSTAGNYFDNHKAPDRPVHKHGSPIVCCMTSSSREQLQHSNHRHINCSAKTQIHWNTSTSPTVQLETTSTTTKTPDKPVHKRGSPIVCCMTSSSREQLQHSNHRHINCSAQTWLPHCVLYDVELKRATSTQQSSPHQLQVSRHQDFEDCVLVDAELK
ncbi:uncharacterized protein LOC125940895 isoform X2 [Dermacentor silvarum]|uniref:uncharacterized protein LOC125940895 isoform X2 n=1 Tax=Dermacentor silvarum TaxID=543639 RepID=UPI0021012758|nr:uncharacterized protein LOC125940895 isoform X2 [Dermacentor silvarum]